MKSELKKNKVGSVYILALACALVLVALVMGMSYQLLQFRRTSRSDVSAERASIYAEFGIRHAQHFTMVEPLWRQLLTSGQWLVDIPVDQAVYSVSGVDPVDGILINNSYDPVILTSTATIKDVTRTIQVEAHNAPVILLRYAVSAGGDIGIDNHVRVNGDITSNADINKTGSDTWVFGDAQAVGTIENTDNITGDISPGSPAKTFPDDSQITGFYQAWATWIFYQPEISDVVLSPTFNPFGMPNFAGLYVINCADQKIVIKNCRIIGTLILINPKSDSKIEAAINWQPALADYPALIVSGNMITIEPDQDLNEDEREVDFSLFGESGYGDNEDVFPNLITGTIYIDGDLDVKKETHISGPVIVTGNVALKDNAILDADTASYYDHPTSMFCYSYLAPIPGTWKQIIP